MLVSSQNCHQGHSIVHHSFLQLRIQRNTEALALLCYITISLASCEAKGRLARLHYHDSSRVTGVNSHCCVCHTIDDQIGVIVLQGRHRLHCYCCREENAPHKPVNTPSGYLLDKFVGLAME